MDNEILTNEMPINSHIIDDIEIKELQCTPTDFYVVTKVECKPYLEWDETANTVTYEYIHAIGHNNCSVEEIPGQGSFEVVVGKNYSDNNINHSSTFNFQGQDVPYYFSQGHDIVVDCNVIEYKAPSKTFVNTYGDCDNLCWPRNMTHEYYNDGEGKLYSINGCFTAIPEFAFYQSAISSYNPDKKENTSNMTNIYMPTTITVIGINAFTRSALQTVKIPKNVREIQNDAFYGCASLESVILFPSTPPTLGYGVFSGNASGRKFYVPRESLEAYKNASGWSTYANDILPM